MNIADLKARLHDVPGIQNLTMQHLVDRDTYGFDGKIVRLTPGASFDEIDSAIRAAASSPMPVATPGNPANPGEAAEAIPVPTASLLPPLIVPKANRMTNTAPGSFAAELKGLVDDAKAGLQQARTEGKAMVADAVKKLGDAASATKHVSSNMAKTIGDAADAALSELGQISNDLGV